MQVEAKRAAALTRQLLMFSRRSFLEVRVLDLNEVVANVLKMLSRVIGEAIELEFHGGSPLPTVEADVGMLERVLVNLCVNARDAMPKGGRIVIATEAVEVDEERASRSAERRPGCFACLRVSDTGVGMEAATLQRLFEPFFTTKPVGKGTGLGLAAVQGIVAQHRGWVEVESRLGEGTTFRVLLPASDKLAPKASAPVSTPRVGGPETILVVEDELSLRAMLTRTLQGLGYRVWEARHGPDALLIWQEHGSDIDLLLTDMVMPEGMSGFELAEKIRAMKPAVRVIITSGYSQEEVQAGRLAGRGMVFLPKPFSSEVLAQTVRHCLSRVG